VSLIHIAEVAIQKYSGLCAVTLQGSGVDGFYLTALLPKIKKIKK
jgi:hypothetical protein